VATVFFPTGQRHRARKRGQKPHRRALARFSRTADRPRRASNQSSQLQRRTYAAPSRVRWPRPACRRTAHPSSVDTTRHQPFRSQTRLAKGRPYLVAGHQAQPNLVQRCARRRHESSPDVRGKKMEFGFVRTYLIK
jgi:hypothetical protein